MPEQFLQLHGQERKEILQTAATKLGKHAIVLEKDIWVCWTLQTLFSMPNAHPMAFKGGTSLSKVYDAINRFSDDVDITLDYRAFNNDFTKDKFDPFAKGVTPSANRRFSDQLKRDVAHYANNLIVPYIETQLKTLLKEEKYNLTISDNGEEIKIYYPSSIEGSLNSFKKRILIELGGRNVVDPNERHIVKPDIAQCISDLDLPSCEVIVLSPLRTFWEKATLIHVACNGNKIKSKSKRLSRHWYDLHKLAAHEIGKAAIKDIELLESVIKHKKVFFNSTYANYDDCLEKKFRLTPNGSDVKMLQNDYQRMISDGLFYGAPPSFNKIILDIRYIEQIINT